GNETNLVGLWNFNDPGQPGKDASPGVHHARLMGSARVVPNLRPTSGGNESNFSLPSVVVGKILDEDGKPLNGVRVRAEQSGVTRAQANSDFTGEFVLNIFYGANPTNYTYDISATLGEKGEWRLDTVLPIGERKSMDFTLKDAISTQGAVMTLDRNTPQASVVVQAIKTSEKAPAPTSANAGENEKVAATVLTDEKGKYKFINLRPGQYRVRCQ